MVIYSLGFLGTSLKPWIFLPYTEKLLGIQLVLCHLCQRRNNLRLEKLDLTSLIIVSSLKAFFFLNLELHVLVIVYMFHQ